jgi:hypothetical protein
MACGRIQNKTRAAALLASTGCAFAFVLIYLVHLERVDGFDDVHNVRCARKQGPPDRHVEHEVLHRFGMGFPLPRVPGAASAFSIPIYSRRY